MIEVLLALAAMGGASLILGQLVTNLSKSQRGVTLGGETEDFKTLVRMRLQSDTGCQTMLLGSAVPAASAALSDIQLNKFFPDGTALRANAKYGNLTITGIRLVRDAGAVDTLTGASGEALDRTIATLELTISKPAGQSLGSQISVVSLPVTMVYTHAAPQNVVNCGYTSPSTSSSFSTCADLGGIYDVKHTPHCYFTSFSIVNPAHPDDASQGISLTGADGKVCLPSTPDAPNNCRSTWPAYDVLGASLNDVSNAGGKPCLDICSSVGTAAMLACGSRYCVARGYTAGTATEVNCTGYLGVPPKEALLVINIPDRVQLRCFK